MSLASRADLAAASLSDPSRTNAELSVERMTSTTAPMPPAGGAAPEDVAAIEAWVAAGMPEGSCGGGGAGGDPFAGGTVCTSGKTWTYGTDVSDALRAQMYPGRACNACHATNPDGESPPIFLVAGTVYPTGHEPDDCFGVDGPALGGVRVEVVDAAGRAYELPVNASGNFMLLEAAFTAPYRAKVISPAGERAMAAPQTSGDCNGCHTEAGAGAASLAPGRIVAPW